MFCDLFQEEHQIMYSITSSQMVLDQVDHRHQTS